MVHKKNIKYSNPLVNLFKEKQIEHYTFNYGHTQVTYPNSYYDYLNNINNIQYNVPQNWFRRWDGFRWRWFYRNNPQGYNSIPSWWYNNPNNFQPYPNNQYTPYYQVNQDPNITREAFSNQRIEGFNGGSSSLSLVCLILLILLMI